MGGVADGEAESRSSRFNDQTGHSAVMCSPVSDTLLLSVGIRKQTRKILYFYSSGEMGHKYKYWFKILFSNDRN